MMSIQLGILVGILKLLSLFRSNYLFRSHLWLLSLGVVCLGEVKR